MDLHELEIGPHFITLYSTQYREMLESAEQLYSWFAEVKPEIADIQQYKFEHELNDPNVYHPFGAPNSFRKAFRHFHIRYGRAVADEDVQFILDNLNEGHISLLHKEFKITKLHHFKLPEFKHLQYPPIEGPYLSYIENLRKGEWIVKGENHIGQ